MPVRYCGKIKIDCKIVPFSRHGSYGGYYQCMLSTKYLGKRTWTRMWNEHIDLPAVVRHPIDSPAAYDEAAHVAISRSDSKLDDSSLEFTHDGYRIRRKQAR